MKQAAESLDQEERGRLYKEVQQITSEEAPWIFIDNAKQNAADGRQREGLRVESVVPPQLQGHLHRGMSAVPAGGRSAALRILIRADRSPIRPWECTRIVAIDPGRGEPFSTVGLG